MNNHELVEWLDKEAAKLLLGNDTEQSVAHVLMTAAAATQSGRTDALVHQCANFAISEIMRDVLKKGAT